MNKSISAVVSPEDYQYIKMILTKRYPSKVMCDEPKSSKLKIIERGNQKSLIDNPDLVNKLINNEDRYSHVVPLHD